MDDICKKLLNPSKLWSRAEVLAKDTAIPNQSGIYAWYFIEIPQLVPTDGCIVYKNLTLLYVGISPDAPSKNRKNVSKQNIRERLRFHMARNACGSTLRLSLGCLLGRRLGIELRRVGDNRMTFFDGETLLSNWLEKNAFVAWAITPEPWVAESILINSISLPLNLTQNASHPFCKVLKRMRKEAKENAKLLPIVNP